MIYALYCYVYRGWYCLQQVMHISREKSRAIPNEQGWRSGAQDYGCQIMRVLNG